MSDLSPSIHVAGGFSQHPDLAVAVGEVVGAVLEGIDPHPGCAVLMAAGDAAERLEEIATAVMSLLAPEVLIASTARGVFGGSQEVAAPSGVGLLAVDAAGCIPLRLNGDDDEALLAGLPAESVADATAMLLGAAGFRFGKVRRHIEHLAPGLNVVGGGPPARSFDEPVRLLLGGQIFTDGAIGVLFPPGVASVCRLGAVQFDEDGDEVPTVGPPELLDAAALVLFADEQPGLLHGPTLDFDFIFEHMDGPMVGMAGRPFVHRERAADDPGTAIIAPPGTALVFNRPMA